MRWLLCLLKVELELSCLRVWLIYCLWCLLHIDIVPIIIPLLLLLMGLFALKPAEVVLLVLGRHYNSNLRLVSDTLIALLVGLVWLAGFEHFFSRLFHCSPGIILLQNRWYCCWFNNRWVLLLDIKRFESLRRLRLNVELLLKNELFLRLGLHRCKRDRLLAFEYKSLLHLVLLPFMSKRLPINSDIEIITDLHACNRMRRPSYVVCVASIKDFLFINNIPIQCKLLSARNPIRDHFYCDLLAI